MTVAVAVADMAAVAAVVTVVVVVMLNGDVPHCLAGRVYHSDIRIWLRQ